MTRNVKNKKRAQLIATLVVGAILAVFFLFPVYCLLVQSVMPDEQLKIEPSLVPEYLNFKPYGFMFTDAKYPYYLMNTLLVCASNILGVVIMASFTAYGLCKVKFKGQNVVFIIILSTVLLPGVVTSIPLYIIYDKLNWTGTLLPLCVPIWFGGGAMNIFLIRQFMKGIPKSYSEAAIIDGASSFAIYAKIILPLVRPILVYLAIMTFIGQWNDFQGPLMYVIDNQRKWTLSLALYKDVADAKNSANLPNIQMALGVLMMIPCLVLFAFFQKELMEGVSAIGIKG